MNQVEILKAKRDYHKTLFSLFLTLMITGTIANWSFKDITSANILFFFLTLLSAFGVIITFNRHDKRHKELIDELRK